MQNIQNICFDKKVFVGVTIIVIILFVYQYYQLYKKYQKYKISKNTKLGEKFTPIDEISEIKLDRQTENPNFVEHVMTPTMTPYVPTTPMVDVVRDYDYRKLYDPLEDPVKRPDRYVMGPLMARGYFDYPTRGYADNFRWLGLLMSTSEHGDKVNKILKLFGRPRYPNTTTDFDYYTMINTGYEPIKVSLDQKKELYDGDQVSVKELGMKYMVQLNKNEDLAYTPF